MNAGFDNTSMALLGTHERVIARDAHLLNNPFDANAETIPAGGTEDAIVTVPAAGAQIDVFRTDVGGKYETKADKKGQFVFAGLPFVGTYVIAASAPNATPSAKGGAKAGREIDYELVLEPGDGRRLTEAEAKTLPAETEPKEPKE